MNKIFKDKIKDLDDYVRTKKNNMKICFHCEEVEDFKHNIELVELFKKEISINNLILIGYKGSLFVKRINYIEYKEYKSFIDNNDIKNEDFEKLITSYSNSSNVNLAGIGSSQVITTLILYYTKIYLDIPYKEKDEEKKKGAKWDNNKKKWYIYYTNDRLHYFINKYEITNDTNKYIDEYINTKINIIK